MPLFGAPSLVARLARTGGTTGDLLLGIAGDEQVAAVLTAAGLAPDSLRERLQRTGVTEYARRRPRSGSPFTAEGDAAVARAMVGRGKDVRPVDLLAALASGPSQAQAVLAEFGLRPSDVIALAEGRPRPGRPDGKVPDTELHRALADPRVHWHRQRHASPHALVSDVLHAAGDPELEPYLDSYVERTGGCRRDLPVRSLRGRLTDEVLSFYEWPGAL